MTKVAFQGESGAFSEDAVVTFFEDAELSPNRYIGDVFEAVLRDDVDFGVVPVENSQAGSINDTYDMLLSYPLNIFGEIHLRISHCLMALPGESLDRIKVIYSHPQALAQCEEFLRRLKADIVPTYDTAGSAKRIKEAGLKGCAAVASKRAAQIYGLETLAEKIETNVNNYTRFFVISKKKAQPAPKSKTSLVFGTKNLPGALYACLGAFATRGMNLTKLESRPSKDKPWEYIFYVDFEGHIDDRVWQEALTELKQKTNFIKILGSYPRAGD
ncbi:MAG: prephenate dehydratase [Chloroflexi bacterium]|nr:prephenate dehydratase [Chloroflexota bacterium]